MDTPDHLGEKYHPLQAKADVSYWQGKALRALGKKEAAVTQFRAASEESGDFQEMAVAAYSSLTLFKALALDELGQSDEAKKVLHAMAKHLEQKIETPAKIDYFATSLPNLLVFEEDLEQAKRRKLNALALSVAEMLKSENFNGGRFVRDVSGSDCV